MKKPKTPFPFPFPLLLLLQRIEWYTADSNS